MTKLIAAGFLAVSLATAWAAGNPTAGKAVYDRACKNCHGADGTPNPNIEKMLKVTMKPLSSPEVQGMTDAQIEEIVFKGKGKMPPVKTVTPAQAADVVAYVRTLKK